MEAVAGGGLVSWRRWAASCSHQAACGQGEVPGEGRRRQRRWTKRWRRLRRKMEEMEEGEEEGR